MDYLYSQSQTPAAVDYAITPAQLVRPDLRVGRPRPVLVIAAPPPPEFRYEVGIVLPVPQYFSQRYAAARGLYRIFNPAVYRFYKSNVAPPASAADGGVPFATNATLPYTPADTFADGTWYLSMSYFDGVLDSGFLPLGPRGETYLKMVVAGGVAAAMPPGQPVGRLKSLAAGVIQVAAYYLPAPDGGNAATQWAIAYTTDGSTPPANAPTITAAMDSENRQTLTYSLPAQAQGTVVKVQLQVRRTISPGVYAYSDPSTVLTATANAAGPSTPLALLTWPGSP